MNKKKIVKIILISAGALILLLLLAGVFVFRHYFGLLSKPEEVPVAPAEPLPTPMGTIPPVTPEPTPTPDPNDPLAQADVYSILLLGSDDRYNATEARTDSMMLITINKTKKQISLTSFLRDSYVFIPEYGYQRLNAANVFGGPQRTIDTILYNFGVTADNFACVNFFTFMDVVDSIGGIEIGLDDVDVYSINNWVGDPYLAVNWDRRTRLEFTSDGHYTLNGIQALAYCRSRDVGGDLRRAEQQRRVIEKVWEKAKGLSLKELMNLAEVVFPQIYTDVDELTCLSLLATMANYKDYTIVQQQIPADGTFEFTQTADGASVLGINFEANREILQELLYSVE